MKKSLIALAAVAATGAAIAQSSVTLYGVADIAVGSVTKADGAKGTLVNGQPRITGVNSKKTNGAQANSGLNNANSRIGFRGTEDLGNGLKASFQFEQAVNLANGATDANGFQRQAWVGLSGDFGSVRAGRQFRPSYDAVVYDIVNTANYSVNDKLFNYDGGTRNNAQIKYTSPSFSGFQVIAGYVFKDNSNTSGVKAFNKDSNAFTTSKTKNGIYDLGVTYVNGPLAAGLGYNYVKLDNEGNGKNSSNNNGHLGASYDFGSFKLAASYHYSDSTNLQGATIGASVPFGAFSVAADVGYAKQRKESGFAKKEDAVNVVLEAKYALSKRTTAYAAYYYAGDDKARAVVAQRNDFKDGFGNKNNYGIGLRHNF